MKLNRKKYKPLTKLTPKIKQQRKVHLIEAEMWQEEVEKYPYLKELDIGYNFFIL